MKANIPIKDSKVAASKPPIIREESEAPDETPPVLTIVNSISNGTGGPSY
jgi:hypothetical protein